MNSCQNTMKTLKLYLKRIVKANATQHISNFDLLAIHRLLQTGFSFKECLSLLKNPKNAEVFAVIDQRLQDGEMIEKLFVDYLEKKYADYFSALIRFESFSISLGLMIEMVQDDDMQNKMYIKNLAYPSLILIATILGIYFFNLWVFPGMLEIMQNFAQINDTILYLHLTMQLIANISLFMLIIILVFILYFKQEKNQVKGYIFFHRFIKQGFWQDFVTNDFVRFFYHCQKNGLSTKQSMAVLCNLPHKPLIAYVAASIDKQLQNGEIMEKALNLSLLDQALNKFMIIAINTSCIEEMLVGYMEINALKVKERCRKLGMGLQLFSYVMLGVMLVFVYQILLMPLGVISHL